MSTLTDILEEAVEVLSEALGEAEYEVKAGRRHSHSDEQLLQSIHDTAVALGAMCEEDEMMDEGIEGKAQQAFGGKKRENLDDSDFAGPNRTYPIMTAQDVRDAARLIGKSDDPEAVKRKIIAIAKRKGFADAIPEAWHSEMKAVEPPYAVKALDDTGDRIGGYAIIFGDESSPDLSPYRDFFTPDTDFWLDAFKTRPMLYHHAMEERTAADPVVGVWDTARVDEIGVWLEGELKKRHTYKQAIKDLIARGALGQSSDSAPHLVKRRWMPNGTHKVVRWPLLASSLTPTPAEPRMIETSLLKEAYKAVGIDWPVHIDDASIASTEDADGTTAQSADERARRLNTLIHILELEATTYG